MGGVDAPGGNSWNHGVGSRGEGGDCVAGPDIRLIYFPRLLVRQILGETGRVGRAVEVEGSRSTWTLVLH